MPYEYLGADTATTQSLPETPEYEYVGPSARTTGEAVVRDIGRTAKAVGSVQAGMPGDIQGMLLDLTSKAFGVDPEKVRAKLQSISQEDSEIPSLFPGSQEIKSGIEAAIPSLKPETEGEAKYEEALELGSSLLGPGGKHKLLNKLVRAGIGTAAGMEAKDIAKGYDLSQTSQEWAKTIASAIPMIVGGKLSISSPESKFLYEAGKKAGLTEEQLTPLLQSEKRVATISKHLNETPERRSFVKSISDSIGDYYENIKKSGREVKLNESNLSELKEKTKDFLKDLEQTVEASPQKKAAIDYIGKSIENLSGDVTAEKLINWWQDINAVAGDVRGAKKAINGLKPTITNAFHKANPELAKDFLGANALWEKRSKFLNSLGWEKLESASKSSLPLKILSGLAVGHYLGSKAMAGILIAEPVFKKISDKLLFDPSWQNLRKSTAEAIIKESPKLATMTSKNLRNKIEEEFPKESKDIDWNKIFSSD